MFTVGIEMENWLEMVQITLKKGRVLTEQKTKVCHLFPHHSSRIYLIHHHYSCSFAHKPISLHPIVTFATHYVTASATFTKLISITASGAGN